MKFSILLLFFLTLISCGTPLDPSVYYEGGSKRSLSDSEQECVKKLNLGQLSPDQNFYEEVSKRSLSDSEQECVKKLNLEKLPSAQDFISPDAEDCLFWSNFCWRKEPKAKKSSN